ncbi:MAG: TonB-dependent receptor [Alistipes sp.]
MKKHLILFAAAVVSLQLSAQEPIYIVNGIPQTEIKSIPPEDIVRAEMLPADEQTIARYGQQANYGVMLITLRYDEPARFPAANTFNDYIASQVEWDEEEPPARVVLRYDITVEGRAVVTKELETTDNRLKRRVLQAVEEAPLWLPATKEGVAVASEGVLNIQLPAGKPMPAPVELILR